MAFYKRLATPIIAAVISVAIFSSCEEELTAIGDGVIGENPFETGVEVFDVFAYNKKINSVKTNGLPLYQLGNFDDPLYGKTVASITTQLQISSAAPIFGSISESEEGTSDTLIEENEIVKEVRLFIPYVTNAIDTDGDGVVDDLDVDPEDPNSDSDGDGFSDNDERIAGTNPLSSTNDNIAFPKKFVLDSIFGNRDAAFNIKIEESKFYLRDLDPNTNFEQSQEYFSNKEFSPEFIGDLIHEGQETVRDTELLFFNEDDADTEDTDESLTVDKTIAPGIWVSLDNTAFFQERILDKEGSNELSTNENFKEFLRGLHITISESDDIFMLLNLSAATVTITYEYDSLVDGVLEKAEEDFVLGFVGGGAIDLTTGGLTTKVGNAVNTFINEEYPVEITEAYNSLESAEKIYLKGGAGSYAEIKLFSEDDAIGASIIDELKSNNWVINEASLVFYVDRETLDAAGDVEEPLRLYLYNTETNQPLYNIATDFSLQTGSSLDSYLFYDGILEKESSKGVQYKIRITDYINNLLIRDGENVTLGLSLTSDIRIVSVGSAMLNSGEVNVPVMSTINPLGTVLFGNNVDDSNSDKQLKLEISYTKPN
ncbi:DUF4270 domain-containing protein [Cellulophaga sp. HaHaR_3_176]|uniref:DUF4270 family protein n=1 Tax=Cellulophaga sp. HaHaR_3_176 TaxID=1942464 RepID=UPI001C1FB7FC|nr:DUF4270 family protein [Cellulophaga sp. HaHaR_3_176]QWX83343.1 DUF4270 domain-containing protein [Cellulophaga sp. HaHaR_3_176]